MRTRLFGGRRLLIWLVLLAGGAAAYWYQSKQTPEIVVEYRTRPLVRGDVESTVSASGTLRALNTVDVGTQVSGQIAAIKADFNTPVKKGQIIAVLDDSTLRQKLREATAAQEIAEATVAQNTARLAALQADLRVAEANYRKAQTDYNRKEKLVKNRAVSQVDFEKSALDLQAGKARVDAAKARLDEQKAQVRIAKAQVTQRAATLAQRKLDLSRTVIRSPVDGVVISRAVNVGQTVAASLQAPVLFKIAEDLRKMQVEVSVDEADIGRIQEGQKVEFTVDTFPGRRFPGTVQQVRKEPVVNSNVVTYTVVVSAANDDLRLLPGMTANVTFFIDRRLNVLKVSNAALRYKPKIARPTGRPSRAMIARLRKRRQDAQQKMARDLSLTKSQEEEVKALRQDVNKQMRSLFISGPSRGSIGPRIKAIRSAYRKRFLAILTPAQRTRFRNIMAKRRSRNLRPAVLYVVGKKGEAKPVRVMVGATDNTHTEIVEGPLKPGTKVIIGVQRKQKKRARLRLRL